MDRLQGRRYADRNASWVIIGYGAVAALYFLLGFLLGRYLWPAC
jgi:hypothetical protein